METNDNFNRIMEMNTEAERRRIAAMAMQGILSNEARMKAYERIATSGPSYESLTETVARNSVRYANALIAELNKKKR